MNTEPPERSFSLLRLLALLVFALPSLASAAETTREIVSLEVGVPALLIAIIGLLVIITFNAMFVASETALELLRPSHLRLIEKDNKHYSLIGDLIENKTRTLAVCTVGSQTMRAWMLVLCIVPAQALANLLVLGSPQWVSLGLSLLMLAIPVLGLNIVFGELIPKSYATVHPVKTLLALRGFVSAFTLFFGWQSKVLTQIADLIAKRFGGNATFTRENAAEEEILSIVESAEKSGEIEEVERELLHSVFEFGDTIAREVMTPRIDLDAVPVETEVEDIMRIIRETGHSRIPIYEGTDDQIIGIIHAKDLLHLKLEPGQKMNIRTLTRPPLFVPESILLFELLKEMRVHRSQMAIVQDEMGGTSGVVTIEDIVEELVGEIVDEYDVETPEIVKDGESFVVDGRVNIDDLNDEIGSEFESEEFDTVGGFIFGAVGRQPQKGEEISLDGWDFRVEETDGRRIVRLRMTPKAVII
ncbi:MAG: hemolysin family protein [Armatimonadetes bacterium]|nr:hemolysin family protein [Armatimonadota bacterium]